MLRYQTALIFIESPRIRLYDEVALTEAPELVGGALHAGAIEGWKSKKGENNAGRSSAQRFLAF
jgi:hypothetical protein